MENLKKIAFALLAFGWSLAIKAQDSLFILMEKGKTEIINKDFVSAKISYEKALEIADDNYHLTEKAKIQNNLGVIYWHLAEYKLSIDSYQEALKTNKMLINDTLIAESQYNLALSLRKLGNNDLAIENFRVASNLFEKMGDEKGQAYIYDVLGNIYADLKDYEKAISYHNNSLEIYEKINYARGISRCYHNLAQVYLEKKEIQKAKQYLHDEKVIKQELGLSVASNHALYGELFQILGEADSAEFYLKSSMTKRLNDGNNSNLALAYFHLGDFYYNEQRFDSAMHYLDLAYVYAGDLGLSQLLIDVIGLKIELNKMTDEGEANGVLYEQLIALNDKVLGEANLREIARFDVEYETMKKDKELLLKKSELSLKNSKINHLNYEKELLSIIVSIIGLTVIFLIMFYFSLRKKKKNLEEKNDQIDYLNKELNHRMVNYFQMFSGMLRYDKKITNQEITKELLNDYINRVNAMSQIQHYLLAENKRSNNVVSLDAYLDNLLGEIEAVLDHSESKIEIEKNLTPVSISYNKALRLGITVNELVHNAFKHGFRNIADPKINVYLKKDGGDLVLVVSDNGRGIQSKKRDKAMGVDLIKSLLHSVDGEIKYANKESGGLEIEVRLANE